MPEPSEPRYALEAVTHPDPWPYYARLRREQPLHFDPVLGLWVAASAAAVEAALLHPQLRVRPPSEPVPHALAGTPVGAAFARLVRMNDGEFHARHRPAIEQGVQRWTLAQVCEAATQAAGELASHGNANALLMALPVRAMARLLGARPAAFDETVHWVQQFTQAIAPGASPLAIAQGSVATEALIEQGGLLGLDEQASIHRIAFMQQSLDATAGLIGNAVLCMEEGLAAPADGAPAWRDWTAELARWAPAVHNTRRFAAADCELAGQSLRAGDGVLLLLASANRDQALNPAPDVFDSERINRRSLGFGTGAHRCPGEAIAIEIAASALRHWYGAGQLPGLFGRTAGFRPLGNARIPVFAT